MNPDLTKEEMWKMYCNARIEREYAVTEREFYREAYATLKSENKSLKSSNEFAKREDQKTFDLLCSKLFPTYKSRFFEHLMMCRVIRDWEDDMLGLVVDGFPNSNLKCHMQDGSTRTVDTMRKDWVRFYHQDY